MANPRKPPDLPAGAPVLLTTTEVALIFRRSPDTIREWRYTGVGPPYIVDDTTGGIWYRLEAVAAYVAELEQR
jgi:hypothetical protein